MISYSHLFQNFPHFVVIHTVKGFGVVNKEVNVFLELSCFFDNPTDVGNLLVTLKIPKSLPKYLPLCCEKVNDVECSTKMPLEIRGQNQKFH